MSKSIVEMVRENQTEPWYDSKTSKVTPGVAKQSNHNLKLVEAISSVLEGVGYNYKNVVLDRYAGGKQYKWFAPTYSGSKADRENILDSVLGVIADGVIPVDRMEWISLSGYAEYSSNGAPVLVIKVADPVKEKTVPLPGSKVGKWIKNEVTRRWEYVEHVVA